MRPVVCGHLARQKQTKQTSGFTSVARCIVVKTVIDSHTVLLLLEEKPIEMLRTINITSDIDVDVARLGPAASSRASLLQLLLIPVFIFGCRTNVQ